MSSVLWAEGELNNSLTDYLLRGFPCVRIGSRALYFKGFRNFGGESLRANWEPIGGVLGGSCVGVGRSNGN